MSLLLGNTIDEREYQLSLSEFTCIWKHTEKTERIEVHDKSVFHSSFPFRYVALRVGEDVMLVVVEVKVYGSPGEFNYRFVVLFWI